MILHFDIYKKNYLKWDALHDFLVFLRTSSNLADFNRLRSRTGKNKLK